MRAVFLVILFTVSILLIIGIIRIGRELRRIRALLEKGAERLEGYLTIILSEDSSGESPEATRRTERETAPDSIRSAERKTAPEPTRRWERDPVRPDDRPERQNIQLTNEEKKMLWSEETRQLFNEVIGDIF